jgi:hypothetical protein
MRHVAMNFALFGLVLCVAMAEPANADETGTPPSHTVARCETEHGACRAACANTHANSLHPRPACLAECAAASTRCTDHAALLDRVHRLRQQHAPRGVATRPVKTTQQIE